MGFQQVQDLQQVLAVADQGEYLSSCARDCCERLQGIKHVCTVLRSMLFEYACRTQDMRSARAGCCELVLGAFASMEGVPIQLLIMFSIPVGSGGAQCQAGSCFA